MTTAQAQAALARLEADGQGDTALAHALRRAEDGGEVCAGFNSSI